MLPPMVEPVGFHTTICMFIKKGSRVYNSEYGFGTALTDEENHIGAVVKFDRENKNLLSAKEISFEMAGDLDYFFESLYLNFCSHLDKDYAKKLFGICYSQGNSIIYKLYGLDNIEVSVVNQNKSDNKDNNKNTFKNSQFVPSKDFVDKVIKDKKKTENMTIKDFAKEKENNMDNLSSYDATLKKQENKDKTCKNDSCTCKNKDNKSCDNNVKYIFVSKDNKELIYGNKEEVADFLWNKKDADEVINETDDIEDFDVYKITGNIEKVPLQKTVKFSI